MISEEKVRKIFRILEGESVYLEYKDEDGTGRILDNCQIKYLSVMEVIVTSEEGEEKTCQRYFLHVKRPVPVHMQETMGTSELDIPIPLDDVRVLKFYCGGK